MVAPLILIIRLVTTACSRITISSGEIGELTKFGISGEGGTKARKGITPPRPPDRANFEEQAVTGGNGRSADQSKFGPPCPHRILAERGKYDFVL